MKKLMSVMCHLALESSDKSVLMTTVESWDPARHEELRVFWAWRGHKGVTFRDCPYVSMQPSHESPPWSGEAVFIFFW